MKYIKQSPDIYLVRHGQSAGNLTPEFVVGRSNHHGLTENGVGQSISLAMRFGTRVFLSGIITARRRCVRL